ncbi:MAG: HlyD family efflux transporter periplasmic adaptor subunit [Bacteroidota bacterium]
MKTYAGCLSLLFILIGCNRAEEQSDAYGNFEAIETIVSAEATGMLQSFVVEEGQQYRVGQAVGHIDTTQLLLRKAQIIASRRAVASRVPDVKTQLSYFEQQMAVQQQQMKTLVREKQRTKNLVDGHAVPSKQLDDITAQIDVLERQMALTKQQRTAQLSALTTQRSGIQADAAPLEEQIKQVDDQLSKSTIINPKAGTVTVKFAEPGEVLSYGKPLYKIADLNNLTLRAYVSGDQLVNVKVGQQVKVLVDAPNDQFKTYEGTVRSISSKAEFTPKIIQTKEERINLVYAIKVSVKNDGSLKIGMPGEVRFQ